MPAPASPRAATPPPAPADELPLGSGQGPDAPREPADLAARPDAARPLEESAPREVPARDAAVPGAAAPRAPAPAPEAPPAEPATPPVARRSAPLAYGSLGVAADAPALVEIDGQAFGMAPLDGIRLSRGEHRILAHFPDGSVAQKTIYLDEQDVHVQFRVR
ncbi:MAG TPA: hypothetical protein VHQ66_03050 [Myxococcota bacterium]|nr:hypothetical protein [Myxococcota bacterium]